MTETRTAEVYRLFDASGELLYVGASFSAVRRFQEHHSRAPWWGEVAHRHVERFPTREAAFSAESEAIRIERPRYNIVSPSNITEQARARLEAAAGFDAERDSAIRQARSEGASLREIAAIVGLSEAGVRRIINKENQP